MTTLSTTTARADIMRELAANMILDPLDVLTRDNGHTLELVASEPDNQRRLVGRNGQNVKAMTALAEWLGYKTLHLSDPDARVTGQGEPIGNTEEPSYFFSLLERLFVAAGCTVHDGESEQIDGELFLEIKAAGRLPNPFQAAALTKVFRAIAIRHGMTEVQLSIN